MDTDQLILIAAVFGTLTGIVLLAVSLVILIASIAKKRKKTGAVIALVVSVAIIAAGVVCLFSYASLRAKEYQKDLDAQRDGSADADENGAYTFRLTDFALTDDSGNPFDNGTLASYRYVVVNRWEPWCGPCKRELPDLERLYEDYRDKGILFVGMYTTKEEAEKVVAEYGLTYPTVFYDAKNPGAFKLIETTAVPVTCIFDSEGRLVPLHLKEEELRYASDLSTEALRAYYDCIAIGARTYEYWAEKLDALPE